MRMAHGYLFLACTLNIAAFADSGVSGTYSGNIIDKNPGRTRGESSITLKVQSVDDASVKATATTTAKRCGGDYAMEGTLHGSQLNLHSTNYAGAAGDCRLGLRLAVHGDKLVGTTAAGNSVELSK